MIKSQEEALLTEIETLQKYKTFDTRKENTNRDEEW
jgi:hypothetical protein